MHSGARASSGSLAYNLAGMAVIAALIAVGAAYIVDNVSRQDSRTNDGTQFSRTIGGRELTIPAAWFRTGGTVKAGFSSQIDLTLPLQPDAAGLGGEIDVTLLPQSRARPSSALLDSVYLHQFTAGIESSVPGLVGKPLQTEAGFADETVWYDPLSPDPFVAKCLAPVSPDAAGRCLRTVTLPSGIAAVYAFDSTRLAVWRSFDARVEAPLRRIGALSAE